MRSRYERGHRPINSSAGETPAVLWGVIRYWNRNLAREVATSVGIVFFSAVLNVWTALSASPLDAG